MSSRQRVPQTGRSNASEQPATARSYGNKSQLNTARSEMTARSSARGDYTNRSGSGSALASARSEASNVSTNEVLRRMREKSDTLKNSRDAAEIEALGDYNAFSRPRNSVGMPLRSVFLDPEINNFPKCRTVSELKSRIKASGTPHPSYDLDGDGYVSQEDYRLAKRFDFDGNGVLDPDERKIGQRVLAEEFFRRHATDASKFGGNIATNTHNENVDALVNAYSFERAYANLQERERTLIAESSEPILSCMRYSGGDHILKHNFYTDKFDATAYNDIDAVPRSSLTLGLSDHGGSRNRLLFTRKEIMRQETSMIMDKSIEGKPKANTRRVNLITNMAIENS